MSLETILKEIKEVKPFAEEDVDSGPMETLAGRRGRKTQAIERLKQLRRQYTTDIMRTAQYLIVVGSQRDQLASALTAPKVGLFSADPQQFYKDLAGRVSPTLYQGRSTVHDLFDVLGRYLEDKANELDIVGYPQLIFKERYVRSVNSLPEFTSLVQQVINEQMGSEVVGIQAVNSIIDNAIQKGHDSKSTSIVLNVESPQLATDLLRDFARLSNRVYLLVAGECPTQLQPAAAGEDAISVAEVNEKTVKQVINTLKGKKLNG